MSCESPWLPMPNMPLCFTNFGKATHKNDLCVTSGGQTMIFTSEGKWEEGLNLAFELRDTGNLCPCMYIDVPFTEKMCMNPFR